MKNDACVFSITPKMDLPTLERTCIRRLEEKGCKIIRISQGDLGLHIYYTLPKSEIKTFEIVKYPWAT